MATWTARPRSIPEPLRSTHALPRYGSLWAHQLIAAGRQYEARLRAQEAIQLDPMNREARELVATLGGAPPPSRRTTGGLFAGSVGNSDVQPPLIESSLPPEGRAGEDGTMQYGRRPPRPRLPTNKLADGRFDFTPRPEFEPPRLRRAPAGPPGSDLARHAGSERVEYSQPEHDKAGGADPGSKIPLRPGEFLGPIRPQKSQDLFPDSEDLPTEIDPALPAQTPPETPPAPPPIPSDLASVPSQTSDAGSVSSDAAAPTASISQPVEQQARQTPDTSVSDARADVTGPALRAPDSPAPGPQPQTRDTPPATAPTTPPTETGTLPTPATSPQKGNRRLLWIGLVTVLLAGGAVGGVLIYQKMQRSQIRSVLLKSAQSVRGDHAQAWLAAKAELCAAAKKHKRSGDLQAGCAVSSAYAQVALKLPTKGAKEQLALANKRAPAHPWTKVASALHSLADGEPKQAIEKIRSIPDDRRGWVATTTLASALVATGKADQALVLLEPTRKQEGSAPASMMLAARLSRLKGELGEADKYVASGLAAAPNHVGLKLQKALNELTRGRGGVVRQQLARWKAHAERNRPALLKDVALIEVGVAIREKQREAALSAAKAAFGRWPRFFELAILLGRYQLQSGGDVEAARTMLASHRKELAAIAPLALYELVEAEIRSGHPDQAAKTIAQLRAVLSPASRKALGDRLKMAAVEIAYQTDSRSKLRKLCKRRPGSKAPSAQLFVCAYRLHQVGYLVRAARYRRALRKRKIEALDAFVAASYAIDRSDGDKAIRALAAHREHRYASAGSFAQLAAKAALLRGKPARALKLARQAVGIDARSVTSQLFLAQLLVKAGHDAEASTLIDQLVASKPSAPRAERQLGLLLLELGRIDQARKLAKRTVTRQPKSVTARLLAGDVALQTNKLRRARRHYAEALRLAPGSVDAHIGLGNVSLRSGRAGKARRRFAKALRKRRNDAELRLKLALIYAKAGMHTKAWPHAKKAFEIYKKQGKAKQRQLAMIAVGRLMRRGNREARYRAEDVLFEVTTGKDPPGEAFYELGIVHQLNDRSERAIWCFRQSLKRSPKHAQSFRQLGLVYRTKGKWHPRAVKALKKYLELAPRARDSKRIRRMIKSLK
jgi:tetratricopeptide (TPR) repeat protein